MSHLPANWKTSALGEIADTQLGKMLNKSKQTGKSTVPYLRNLNVQWGRIDINDLNSMDIELNERDKFTAKKGDLLVCEGGESGRSAIWQGDEPIGFQNALHRIRPNAGIATRYLFYYFEWIVKNRLIDHLFNGVTIKHFPQENLRMVKISYPPIDEQHQIVEILEDHLSRLDAALTYLELASIQINAFEMSSINKAIESVPSEYLPLRTVIERIEAGKSFTCLSRKSEPDEWGIIKVSAMTWGEFLPQENKAVPPNREVNVRSQIHQGDILISRANTEKYVGAPVFVRDEPPRLLLSDKSLRLKPAQEIDPNWLITVLRAPTTREKISARSTGMKDSMRNISQKSLLSVEVPVPITLSDQNEVIRNANEARDASIQLRNTVESNLKLLGSLRRSLLQAAFTGQLTREAIHV